MLRCFCVVTLPLTQKRCWRGIPESAASTAGNSAGNKGSAGKSAGSSAALLCSTSNGTASSTLPGTPLVPGTVPGSPRSTFQEFLSSTAFFRPRNPRTTPTKSTINIASAKRVFCLFLGSDNLHTTRQKIPPDEEGPLWGWNVVGDPLFLGWTAS